MDDKTLEYINDITEYGKVSECCGAPVVLEDICTDCKEHCGMIEEIEDDAIPF